MIIPTLFIVTIIVFLSVRFIPGDVVDTMESRSDVPQLSVMEARP